MNVTQYWSLAKLAEFISHAEYLKFDKGEIVYDIGDPSDRLYFVAKGEFANGVMFDLKNYNKYPTGMKEWELLVTTRRLLKTIETFKSGSVFGQLELGTPQSRRTQVSAATRGKLYFITFDTYCHCIAPRKAHTVDFAADERKRLARRLEQPRVDPRFEASLAATESAQKNRVCESDVRANVEPGAAGRAEGKPAREGL